MKILHVSSARHFGGGERHLVDLARGLAGRGHEIYSALRPDSPLRAEMLSLNARGVFELPLRNSFDIRSALGLARFVRKHEVEIVHAHVARDYPLAALAVRRSPSARLVVTRHVLFPLGRAHRLALANVSRVVAVSEAVARSLRARSIFSADKIRVVPNGVDVRKFEEARRMFEHGRREPGSKPHAPLRVGIVGELSEVKGQDIFIRAARMVVERFKGSVEFVIVGDEASNAGGQRAALESLVSELRLTNNVRFTGRCEDVAALLASLDVFVSASRSEAFGIALVEAMASGLPVVAAATEGAREIIEEGKTGLMVPVNDADSLAAVVSVLLGDEPRRRALGERARETAAGRFSLERMIADTERVYAEALGL